MAFLLAFVVQVVMLLFLLAWVGAAQQTVPAAGGSTRPCRMPCPVSSFGAAELEGWIYLFGGHGGRTHRYSANSQWAGFVRTRLDDPSVSEDLPGGERIQSTALVAASGRILRIGGMRVEGSGREARLISLASAAAFDPETMTWSALPALPEPRSSHDAVALGARIYVFGGWTLAGTSDEAQWLRHGLVLDLEDLRTGWLALAQPFVRRGIAVTARAREVFVFGGMDAADELANAVDVFAPDEGTWRKAPPLPEPGFGLAAACDGKRLFVSGRGGVVWELASGESSWRSCGELFVPRLFHRMFASGGALTVLGGSCDSRPVGWIERLDPDHGTSSAVFALPFAGRARQRQALFERDGVLHLFGGNVALEQHAFEPEDFLDESWQVELGAGLARALPPLPRRRQSMVCVPAAGDEKALYALGGFGHDGELDRCWDEIWRCELETGAWTVVEARLPRPLTQFRALVHGAELLIVGGMDFERGRDDSMQLSDQVYSVHHAALEAGFHEAGMRLPAPRRAFGAALVGEKLYLAGGLDASFNPVETFDAYDFDGGTWSVLPAPSAARLSPELIAQDGKLYLCAGLVFDSERHARPADWIEEFDPALGIWRTLPVPLPIDAHEVQAYTWHGKLAFVSTWNERGALEIGLVDPRLGTPRSE